MPQDNPGATLDELQSLVAGVEVDETALPKPCVAGSNPAGGTAISQEKSLLTSTNTCTSRSCRLSPSATVERRLPPSAKLSRNGSPMTRLRYRGHGREVRPRMTSWLPRPTAWRGFSVWGL